MNYQEAISQTRSGLNRVMRPDWTDLEAVYPRLGYLINARHAARKTGRWSPEEIIRIPEGLILKIEGGLLYGRGPYEPEPEDLVAEDWVIFVPSDNFPGSDWELRELIYPEDLWPEDEDE